SRDRRNGAAPWGLRGRDLLAPEASRRGNGGCLRGNTGRVPPGPRQPARALVNAESLAASKRALVERAAVSRMRLRREARMLRASVAGRSALPRIGAARFAIGVALALTGLARGARIAAWMRRGLVVANVSLAVAGFFAARVRNRTDATGSRVHARPSTGEHP